MHRANITWLSTGRTAQDMSYKLEMSKIKEPQNFKKYLGKLYKKNDRKCDNLLLPSITKTEILSSIILQD